ncbi:right-handed parallel beta-helix repeat-containing protein [Thermorudis peleae]|uniref:right-handed parallel beta-helix repeat-containing protein n=1 Tax=Thermorudis peleae TaxID=1382356 RepID=UPI000570A5CB|nr:right-handed parallel beta-helix repeat-containing protein [Thermorudis peleae]
MGPSMKLVSIVTLVVGMFAGMTVSVDAAAGSACVNPSGAGGCFTSIQTAINAVVAGGVVTVEPGTYHEMVTITKPVILKGAGASVTILDATGLTNGIKVVGVTGPTLISGFTVENANQEGILLESSARITVVDNIVQNNDRQLNPQMLTCDGALPMEQFDCGEGIHLLGTAASLIARNIVQHNAGGILLSDDGGAPLNPMDFGPTHDNVIMDNIVQDNPYDCGITLASHYFHLGASVDPAHGGVYHNQILRNYALRNGVLSEGAGIGLFAGPPSGATYNNTIAYNVANGNGLPGIALHSHTPFQNLNGNVIVQNALNSNGPDSDAATGHPAGIVLFSDTAQGAAPVTNVTVASNTIANEYYGIFATGVTHIAGLPSNVFNNVTVPVYWPH